MCKRLTPREASVNRSKVPRFLGKYVCVCVSDVFDYHQIWKKTGDGVWNENTMSFGVLALIEQFGFSIVSELV